MRIQTPLLRVSVRGASEWASGEPRVAGAFVVGTVGVVIALAPTRFTDKRMRSRLALRTDLLFDPWLPESFLVNIEDPATHEQTKVVTEDKAICLPDPTRRQIVFGHPFILGKQHDQ